MLFTIEYAIRGVKKKKIILFIFLIAFLIATFIISLFLRTELKYPPSKYIGIFTNYENYDNGKIRKSLLYCWSSQYTGSWNYRLNGKLVIAGYYNEGFPTGTWIYYNLKGDVQFLEIYINSSRSKMYEFNKNGDVMRKIFYKISYKEDLVIKSILEEFTL